MYMGGVGAMLGLYGVGGSFCGLGAAGYLPVLDVKFGHAAPSGFT